MSGEERDEERRRGGEEERGEGEREEIEEERRWRERKARGQEERWRREEERRRELAPCRVTMALAEGSERSHRRPSERANEQPEETSAFRKRRLVPKT